MSAHVVQQLVDLLSDLDLPEDVRVSMFLVEDASTFEKLAAAERYLGMDADELAEAGAIVPLSDFPV